MSEERLADSNNEAQPNPGNKAIKLFVAIVVILTTAALINLIYMLLFKADDPGVTSLRILKLVIAGNKEKLKKIAMPESFAQIDSLPSLKGIKPEKIESPDPSLTIQTGNQYKTVFYIEGTENQYQVGIILNKSLRKWKIKQLIIDSKPLNKIPEIMK